MDYKNGTPDVDPIELKKQVDALYDALAADDVKAGNDIIRAMGEKKNGLAVEPLTILLEYGDEAIRSNAALALGMIGNGSAVEPLIKTLKDPSPLVQTNAVIALGEIGDERAVEPLELMDISRETPALMNLARKSINRIKTRGVVDGKLYLKEQAAPAPEQPAAIHREEKEHVAAEKIGSAAIGLYGKAIIAAGLVIALALIVIVGAIVYPMIFPSVWSEQLPYKNSTGHYQSIIVYRNATDTTYDNLTRFLAGENESIKNAIFNDNGDKCVEYAARLHDDAERAQINCSVVGTGLSGGVPGHALVAFNSKDQGTVYVDPFSTNVSPADFGPISMDRIVFLRDKWKQPQSVKNANGDIISTVEYRNAGPVTYDALMAFLSNDTTETALYADPSYTCADFAAHLHDVAEEQGIKSGIVAITFTDNSTPGHSFNAFPTTDKGIVYIDDTGLNSSERTNGGLATDAVVYLEAGQYLGELPANQTNGSLDYGFYLARRDRLDAYNDEWKAYMRDIGYYTANKSYYEGQVDQYNKDKSLYEKHVSEYNDAVDKYNAGDGTYSHDYMITWKNNIDNEHSNLDKEFNSADNRRQILDNWRQNLLTRLSDLSRRDEAKWYINHPPGIVKDIYVYW